MERLKELSGDIYKCIHCKACRFSYSGEPSKKSGIGEHKGKDGRTVLYEGMVQACPSGIEFGWEAYWNAGRIWIARAVLEGELDLKKHGSDIAEVIFPCITCGMCGSQCENNVRTVDIIEALRAAVLEAGVPAMDKHELVTGLAKKLNNPYGGAKDERMLWAKEAGIEDVIDKKGLKIAYFVGCTAAYRQKSVAGATVKLLRKIGVDVTVLSDEVCCGSPFFRVGKTEEAQRLMKDNMKIFSKFDKILFSCAGCYRTITVDYPKWTKEKLPFATHHAMEIIADLVKEGKIKFKSHPDLKGKVITYHDPCHIGRHMGEHFKEEIIEASENMFIDARKIGKKQKEWFEIPRTIMKALPDMDFKEMYRIKMDSFCCGAGGGVRAQYPEFSLKTASRRVDEAEAVGADILLTECPFCKTNLSDGNDKYEHGLTVYGLLQMIDEFDLLEKA